MLTGTINFKGKTLTDVELAIKEALKCISNDNTTGMDSNEDGEFDFEIFGEEESS